MYDLRMEGGFGAGGFGAGGLEAEAWRTGFGAGVSGRDDVGLGMGGEDGL
jgi:hypothetical protein